MPLLIAVLLGLSGLIVVIYPLLGLDREAPETLSTGPIAEVAERERSARDALREVEFDHRLGNLDDADYAALRSRYERRALSALKQRYQREQELDALIEQQLDALRLQERAPHSKSGAPAQVSSPETPTQATTKSRIPRDASARSVTGPQARRRRGGRW